MPACDSRNYRAFAIPSNSYKGQTSLSIFKNARVLASGAFLPKCWGIPPQRRTVEPDPQGPNHQNSTVWGVLEGVSPSFFSWRRWQSLLSAAPLRSRSGVLIARQRCSRARQWSRNPSLSWSRQVPPRSLSKAPGGPSCPRPSASLAIPPEPRPWDPEAGRPESRAAWVRAWALQASLTGERPSGQRPAKCRWP